MGLENKERLEVSAMLNNYFEIEVGNAIVKISKKQFAELSEQIFEYWRINVKDIPKISPVRDFNGHLEWLKGEGN